MSAAMNLIAFLIPLLPLFAILALWIGSLYDPRLQHVLYKLHLLRVAFTHMFFSTDKRWNARKVPDSAGLEVEAEKTILLVRHGESAWNLVFNKGFGLDWPKRLGDALAKEAKLLPTLDSVFVDSPLSKEGTDQAEDLQRFVETGETEWNEILRGTSGKSIIVSSNLRRALSTITIGMWDRLKRTQERIFILSSLQEVTFNVDGVSLAKAGHAPQLADTELESLYGSGDYSKFDPDRYYDCSYNAGNKPVFTTGLERMKKFCDWCFEQEEDNIIACGHSLYYRYFFRTFLPKNSNHVSKNKKMDNCAVVVFKLKKGKKGSKVWYSIDEESIKPLHHGFEAAKKKKKVE